MLTLIKNQLTASIIKLATELAEQAIERDWGTTTWSHEIVRDEDGSLLFTGQALETFKEYYDEYFELLSNELLN